MSEMILKSIIVLTKPGIKAPDYKWRVRNQTGCWVCNSDQVISPRIGTVVSNGIFRRYFYSFTQKYVPYPPSCNEGDLLDMGMRQIEAIGEYYRKYLIEFLNFLPPHLNHTLMSARSSSMDSCFRSAESFFTGLYPPSSPGEMINITTGTPDHDPIVASYNKCEDLQLSWSKYVKTSNFIKRMNESKQIYESAFESMRVEQNDIHWMYMGDWLTSHYCSDQELPDWSSELLFNRSIMDAEYLYGQYFSYESGIVESPLMRIVMKHMESSINGSEIVKFMYFSLSDLTFMSLSYSLGYRESIPFASHIALELWQNKDQEPIVRATINGNSIFSMKYTSFKMLFAQKINRYCLEL